MKYTVTANRHGRVERVNIDDGSSKVEIWREDREHLVLKVSGRMARGLHIGEMEYRPVTFYVTRILERMEHDGDRWWVVEDVTDFPASKRKEETA